MGKSCKVVVCGQGAVGKTAVLEQLLYANHVAGTPLYNDIELQVAALFPQLSNTVDSEQLGVFYTYADCGLYLQSMQFLIVNSCRIQWHCVQNIL